jgi:hypothetical protein
MSTYFTTDDAEIEMRADAPGVNAVPEFIGFRFGVLHQR